MYRGRTSGGSEDSKSPTQKAATLKRSVFAPRTRRGNIHICCIPIRKQWLIRNKFYFSIILLSISYIFFIAGIVLANLYATRLLVDSYAQSKIVQEAVSQLSDAQSGMIDAYYQLFLTTAEQANLFANLIESIMLEDSDKFWWNVFPFSTPTMATINFTSDYLQSQKFPNPNTFSISTTNDLQSDLQNNQIVTWELMQNMTLLNHFIPAINNTNTSNFRKKSFGFLFFEGENPAAMITYPAGYNLSFPTVASAMDRYWYDNTTQMEVTPGLFTITVRYLEQITNSYADKTRVITLAKMILRNDGTTLGIVFTEFDIVDIQNFNNQISKAAPYLILFVQDNRMVANYLPGDKYISNNNATFFDVTSDYVTEPAFTLEVWNQLTAMASSSVTPFGALFSVLNVYGNASDPQHANSTGYDTLTYYNVIGAPNNTVFYNTFYLTVRINIDSTHETLYNLSSQIQSGMYYTLGLAGGIQFIAFLISFILAILRAASFLKPLTILSEFAESISSANGKKKTGKDKQKKQEDLTTANKKEISNIDDGTDEIGELIVEFKRLVSGASDPQKPQSGVSILKKETSLKANKGDSDAARNKSQRYYPKNLLKDTRMKWREQFTKFEEKSTETEASHREGEGTDIIGIGGMLHIKLDGLENKKAIALAEVQKNFLRGVRK